MPASKRMKSPRIKWTFIKQMEIIRLLTCYKDSCWREVDGWNAHAWNLVMTKFKRRFPKVRVTLAQVKRRMTELTFTYRLIKEIIKRRDVFWCKACKIITKDEVWDELIQADPRVKELRGKHFLHYPHFEFLYDVDSFPRKRALNKRGKCSVVGMTTHTLSSSVGIMQPIMKPQCPCDHHFPISRCIAILNDMKSLTHDDKVAGSDIFHNAQNRQIFLSLSPHLRCSWIQRRIAGQAPLTV